MSRARCRRVGRRSCRKGPTRAFTNRVSYEGEGVNPWKASANAPILHRSSILSSRAGKYLTFSLGSEEFGIPVLKVREIMGVQEITAIPQTPAYVKGVINLRGKVIPVVDLRAKFGLPQKEYTKRTSIVVVQIAAGIEERSWAWSSTACRRC